GVGDRDAEAPLAEVDAEHGAGWGRHGVHPASAARAEAEATSSCARSGSRVVMRCSHSPGRTSGRIHAAPVRRAEKRKSSKDSPATTGTKGRCAAKRTRK